VHSSVIVDVTASGVTAGLPDGATLLSWLAKDNLIEPAGTTVGSLAWTFSAPDSAFDYLAAAQTVTLTYTVRISDPSGAAITQPVIITVTGTNDLPVFAGNGATISAALAEAAGVTGSTASDTTGGVLTFTDADLADTHTLTVTSVAVSGVVAGLPVNTTLKTYLTRGVLTEAADQTPGLVPWAFAAPDKTFDYLAAGQSATLTYVVTLADNKGGSVTQNVAITVTGANDAPVIASTTTAARSLTERSGLTGSVLADTATGAIKFTDPDNGDVHTLTVTGVSASGSTTGVPSSATLLSWLSFGAVTEPAGTTPGSTTWTFSAPDSAFDYLAAGESLVLTYATVVTDSSGASVNQDVVLTITGTNDKPVAAPHSGLATDNWTALTVTAAQLLAGATDPDVSDSQVLSSVQGAAGGTVAIVGGNAVFTPTATKTGPASFTYTISDGHGGTSVGTVNLTVSLHQITGTSGNDSLAGSSKQAQIDGLAGNDTILAGSAGDLITGGAGNDALTGGAGIDTFAYHAGFGLDTITSFAASGTKHDVLQFDSNVFADWAHLLGATTQVGADLQITLDPTDKITLKNVTLASFTSADATFV
jgi:VCBS repeat-containing protein